jgi:nitrate/nitrite-specific signal transduction histidine kinase
LLDVISQDFQSKASPEYAKSIVRPNSLSFNIDYTDVKEILNEYRISISRKELIIALRNGHPISEQIYFSKAPVDSDTHIEFLKELEKIYFDGEK